MAFEKMSRYQKLFNITIYGIRLFLQLPITFPQLNSCIVLIKGLQEKVTLMLMLMLVNVNVSVYECPA